MAAVNRQTIRDALAALLSTALVGTGLPVQAVYAYPVSDFGTQSPVVVLQSADTTRANYAAQGDKSWIGIDIIVFVVYAATSWTAQNAEDRLDLIEKSIADVIEARANQATTNWAILEYRGESVPGYIVNESGGIDYRTETIPVRVKVIEQ